MKVQESKAKGGRGSPSEHDETSVHVASLVDLRQLKHAKLAKHLQTYEGCVMLREDNVKDDNGYIATFAEQSPSASQMAAARFLSIQIQDFLVWQKMPTTQYPRTLKSFAENT